MKRLIILIISFFMLSGLAMAEINVTFQWDANTESDLAGYAIYQSNTSNVYGEMEADIPLNDILLNCSEGKCVYTLNNIPDGEWFWVFTAYDTFRNESGFSNEVTVISDTTPPEPPQNMTIWQKIIAWVQHWFMRGKALI